MTRGNLMIVVVLILALVGMFFWTLSLHHRQTDLVGGSGSTGAPDGGGAERGARLVALERRVEHLGGLHDASLVELSQLSGRVGKVEEANRSLGLRLAGLDGAAVADSEAPAADGMLREAIEGVLEERREEERLQRLQRMAQGMSRWLLADVAATPEQTQQFVKVVTAYLDERDKIRERYSGENENTQAREADLKTLEEDRNAKLLTIFDQGQFVKIEERLNRGRGMLDGRSPAGRDRGSRGPGRGR